MSSGSAPLAVAPTVAWSYCSYNYEESISLLAITFSNDYLSFENVELGNTWSSVSHNISLESPITVNLALHSFDFLHVLDRATRTRLTSRLVLSHENEVRASMALSTQCALSLASVVAELAPVPHIGVLVSNLTAVFQAVEKSRVNKEQWKLLQGRCVMVSRIAGAQVANYGGEHYDGLQHASDILCDVINRISGRARYWNQMHELLAFVQFQEISEEIWDHFSTLDSCLNLFSYTTDIARTQWVSDFDAVQGRELAQLEQMRTLLNRMDIKLNMAAQTQDAILKVTTETNELLERIMAEKVMILQNQATTPHATYADAQQIVQTIRTVTSIQLPTNLLVGRQCIPDTSRPTASGYTGDIWSASFLMGEKVAKKVFRLGATGKEHVEPYAHYLHNREPPVVHSGMRGDNILITDSGGGVLGGFGLTKALENSTVNERIPVALMAGKVESYRWMAPEMFAEDSPVLQTPSDVWSWGMTVLELISGQRPYHQHKHTHLAMLNIQKRKRPLRANYADFEKYALKPDDMWALLERCWAYEPRDRPTIDEVIVELAKMMK
ncbi:hypothetical protein FRC12_014141 [Ceratobasidium sp. 428]|nr:hypothetical protein FRC12_014141 [Ceratobasidium sp. 428]